MADFFADRDQDAEALQDDLDFWRKRLKLARDEIAHAEEVAAGYLHCINDVKRKAYAKGIDLK